MVPHFPVLHFPVPHFPGPHFPVLHFSTLEIWSLIFQWCRSLFDLSGPSLVSHFPVLHFQSTRTGLNFKIILIKNTKRRCILYFRCFHNNCLICYIYYDLKKSLFGIYYHRLSISHSWHSSMPFLCGFLHLSMMQLVSQLVKDLNYSPTRTYKKWRWENIPSVDVHYAHYTVGQEFQNTVSLIPVFSHCQTRKLTAMLRQKMPKICHNYQT